MDKKPINDVVAEAIRSFMGDSWTNVRLAREARVAEGTIRNCLDPTLREPGKLGKEPSVKVTELAKIAAALGVDVSDLVTDATEEERQQIRRQRAADYYVRTGKLPSWAPEVNSTQPPGRSWKRSAST